MCLGMCGSRRGLETVDTGFRTEQEKSILSSDCSTCRLVTLLTDSKTDPPKQGKKGTISE